MAYIITCCGVKRMSLNPQESSLEKLSFSELNNARKQLIQQLNISLNWQQTCPAYELYQGRLYSQIDRGNFLKPKTDIIILSALFGLIKHTDLLPMYDLMITYRIPTTQQSVASFWLEQNLNQYITPWQNHIDLLSDTYRRAFNTEVGMNPNIEWRDRYGVHKGRWLNEQLQRL
ncbi:MAG: peroxide stress protein YaaA [Phycisphaerales bacterium]|nr:peroxide stress protein YaaA [Phycisphaerales bacterium]